jgi:hypothetical protein
VKKRYRSQHCKRDADHQRGPLVLRHGRGAAVGASVVVGVVALVDVREGPVEVGTRWVVRGREHRHGKVWVAWLAPGIHLAGSIGLRFKWTLVSG